MSNGGRHSRRSPVRGIQAVAERPDGTRVHFLPFPTPMFDRSGEFIGAVNVLVDLTEYRQIAELRSQADRCRRLARDIPAMDTAGILNCMAAEFEAKAAELERPFN